MGEEIEEEEENTKDFDAARLLQIMLNPLDNTNRFLRYEFMKEKNRIQSDVTNCTPGIWDKIMCQL